MRKVFFAVMALTATTIALSPNALADSQLAMGGVKVP